MNKISKIAAGSVVAAGMAVAGVTPALADKYVPRGKVVYERPADWSGVYFGVQSGYSWADYDARYTAFGTTYGVSPDTSIVGGHIGLQHQFGHIVIGVEGNWVAAIRDDYDTAFCPNPAFSCGARLNDILSVGPRLGWAAGHWMPYVTGGYATATFEDERRNVPPPSAVVFTGSERHHGWYIGGGFEWIVSPGWTFGLEYRHYEFDSATHDFVNPLYVPAPLERVVSDATLDTVTARVSWRWGRPEPAPLK
jgi:outer membrane immunogenic protein